MNKWGIPDWLEKEVKERDKTCIYCGIKMIEEMPPHSPRKAVATWEHIINDESIISRENIARCCLACNSSKGTKKLSDWIQSSYCKKRGINKDTVADVLYLLNERCTHVCTKICASHTFFYALLCSSSPTGNSPAVNRLPFLLQ